MEEGVKHRALVLAGGAALGDGPGGAAGRGSGLLLILEAAVHPGLLTGAVVALPPEIEEGDPEKGGHLLLLLPGGGLAAGLELFRRIFGKAQGLGEGGTAETPFGAQGFDALCQCDHRKDLLSGMALLYNKRDRGKRGKEGGGHLTHSRANWTAASTRGEAASRRQATPTSLTIRSSSLISRTPERVWERKSSEGRKATPSPPWTM